MLDHASRHLRRNFIFATAFISSLLAACSSGSGPNPQAQTTATIGISSSVPNELNPPFVDGPTPTGGAPAATPAQAADFAWREFVALSWPAGPQAGNPGQRDTPSTTQKFGDPSYTGPLVWQTFRGKVEIFPGQTGPSPVPPFRQVLPPPGYPGPTGDKSLGYDALSAYNYSTPIPACDPRQAKDPTPWINLDETDQITLDNMYAGAAPASATGNSAPQLIRFLAKANRAQYVYVTGNSTASDPTKLWWSAIPQDIVTATKNYLIQNQKSPTANNSKLVSLPNGTIEVKAGWRPLTPAETTSGRFHTQMVRFYEPGSGSIPCYRDATWGLVSLHIIQKTPSAPYFIYATFEQTDNLLTADGKPVEDVDGRQNTPVPATGTTPQVCLVDPQPPSSPPPPPGMETTSALGTVIQTANPQTCKALTPATYCTDPGKRLYYHNALGSPPNAEPSGGNICVNKRDNAIPDYVIAANSQAHAAIAAYLKQAKIPSSPWLFYKLINVQYLPYDKIPVPGAPNGSVYTSKPPYTATNPAPSSFYQANIVVETNRSLQMFSGGLSPNISTDWNADGTPHKNTFYNGHSFNMGGCMGCHGSQGQFPKGQAGDFSVILARGSVAQPEVPVANPGSAAARKAYRNRSLVQ